MTRVARKAQSQNAALLFFYGNDNDSTSKIYAARRYARLKRRSVRATRDTTMIFEATALKPNSGALSGSVETLDLGSLPTNLSAQCQGLIESYHDIHGYTCLPNMLWRAELGDFIKTHPCLRYILRKSSTTRSAKAANKGFVEIATAILSLEILASDFASWSTLYPEAKAMANALLRARCARMFLMEYYLYPPKHISPAILAALAPPANRTAAGPDWPIVSGSELHGQKLALSYANAMIREDFQRQSDLDISALPASRRL